MVTIHFNGTQYTGRLTNIYANAKEFRDENNILTYVNEDYDVTIMDAFGAEITLVIKDLKQIEVI